MRSTVFFFYFLFFIAAGIHAQVHILTRGGNHFFIGIDNAVTVTSKKLNVKKLTVTIDKGTVAGADGFYTVRCSAPSANALIRVLYKGKVVALKKMEVLRISDPEVYAIGSKLFKSGPIAKAEFEKLYALTVKTNVPFLAIVPVHFRYKRMRNNELLDVIENESPMFSNDLKDMIKNARAGDTIIFDNITCTGPDAVAMRINTVKLAVMEN
ncbi:MAG: hypothetical protein JST86_06770 [Bacteroidetes bacterium]|nr:hypothetical protein [Bacteroidota bacterium]